MLQLVFKDGKTFSLDKDRIRIGRDKSNEVVLDSNEVSGFHAEISTIEEKWFVTDLQSKNKTLVNGKSTTRTELKAWDSVVFANVEAEIIDTESRRPTKLMNAVGGAEPQVTQVRQAVGLSLVDLSNPSLVYPISPEGRITVGRDNSNLIRIDAKTVSSKHAELFFERNDLIVKDFSSTNGTFVNGEKIDKKILRPSDIVSFDVFQYKVTGQGISQTKAAAEISDKTQARATVTAEQKGTDAKELVLIGDDGKRFEFGSAGVMVGRDKACNVVIEDGTVSSKHAEIRKENGDWYVKDLQSTNGTFVEGSRIEKSKITPGQQVRFGKKTFRLEFIVATAPVGTSQTQASPTERIDFQLTDESIQRKKKVTTYAVVGIVVLLIICGIAAYLFVGSRSAPYGNKVQINSLWSIKTEGEIIATPALGDINGDKVNDVIFANTAGTVRALDGITGKLIYEVKVTGQVMASIALIDMDNNGKQEVIVATTAGEINVIDDQGRIFWKSPDNLKMGNIVSSPVLGDFNKDGVPDIVVGSENMGIVVLEGKRGWMLWNSAKKFTTALIATPLITDVNGDGVPDIIAIDHAGNAVALNGTNGWVLWEQKLEGTFVASPALVRLGSDRFGAAFISEDGTAYLVRRSNGALVWTYKTQKKTKSSPIAVDINKDSRDDIFFTAGSPALVYAIDGRSGDKIWSNNQIQTDIDSSPAVIVTDQGPPLLVLTLSDGSLTVIDAAKGWIVLQDKLYKESSLFASPVIGDVGHHKYMDIVVATRKGEVGLYATNIPTGEDELIWSRFLNRR